MRTDFHPVGYLGVAMLLSFMGSLPAQSAPAKTTAIAPHELNCPQYIQSGQWYLRTDGDNAGRWGLRLTPTQCGRQISRTAEFAHMWEEVVRKFGDSRYFLNPRSLMDQLQCHLDNAVNNPTWNLEPHRPDVGLSATKAAQCNPAEASLYVPPN